MDFEGGKLNLQSIWYTETVVVLYAVKAITPDQRYLSFDQIGE